MEPREHVVGWDHSWIGFGGSCSRSVVIVGLSSPALAGKRLELSDADGHPVGYALVDHHGGRVDYYDLHGRRIGWGRVNALRERYRVDFFSAGGLATGYALVDQETGQVEFFDHRSHPLGFGRLDRRGRVATVDLAGRRGTDTALPVQTRRPAEWDRLSE